MSKALGTGGFDWPQVYEQDQQNVLNALRAGTIEYADLSQWSFSDEFLCFALKSGFLKMADQSYPNPRVKNEVPVWFLLSTQLLMRIHQSSRYHQLQYLLNAGSILSRVGFNVRPHKIGFNDKNKFERKTACDPDTVRKFYKDTPPGKTRAWFNEDIQSWFRTKRAFDSSGIFILDQSHLVVPDNPNYKSAVRMPVDHFGQLYKNYGELSAEQKRVLPHHPCYSVSTLLHTDLKAEWFHVSQYAFGPGNEDELPQADRIIDTFCKNHPGVIKELIMDRGYLDGERITKYHRDHSIDTLIPLRKGMDTYEEALGISEREGVWNTLSESRDQSGHLIEQTLVAEVMDLDVWDGCEIKQYATVAKQKIWEPEQQDYLVRPWVLCSTKHHPDGQAINRYKLRTQIEERYRQFKHSWGIADFCSPNEALLEVQICFTLLTYSLLQLYLRRSDLQSLTGKLVETLKREEALGKNVVIVYTNNQFAILNLDDYSTILLELDGEPREKLKHLMAKQREARLNRSH
jgi:hypothetical protein